LTAFFLISHQVWEHHYTMLLPVLVVAYWRTRSPWVAACYVLLALPAVLAAGCPHQIAANHDLRAAPPSPAWAGLLYHAPSRCRRWRCTRSWPGASGGAWLRARRDGAILSAMNFPAAPAAPANDARTAQVNRFAVGCAALSTSCLVLTYACFGLLVLLGYRYGQSPDHLVAQADYPLTVRAGERFDLTVTLRNWGTTPITITEVSLGNADDGALLDGVIVRKADEALTRKADATGYTCDIPLAPGEQRDLVFTLESSRTGEFGSSLRFTTSDGGLSYDVAVGVKPP
jgi:hypothetical protein